MKNKRSKSLLLLLALALLVAAALPISAFAASGDKGSHAGLVPAAGIQVDITEPDSVATTTYPESMETITITPGTRGNTKLTITVTNTGAEEKVLSFHYSYTGATYESFTVDGEPVSSTDATISKTVASKGVVELYLHTNKVTDTTLTLSDFALLDNVGAQASVAITGKGTVSVDGAGVANGESAPIDANSQFVATPASGYTFMGWVDANNKILSHDATYKPGWTADSSIHAIFADSSIPCFRVGKEYLYADLDSALTMATSGKASSKVVVVANSATLTGSHSIPSGVTLLVPFDTMEEPMGEIPDFVEQETGKPETKWAKPTAYRTLTLAEGASITVDNGGKLEVSGKMHSVQGYCGSPTGPVGFINMGEDSSITVKSGGALYAWGFITGHDTATVTIKSGGKVYENFQIIDWRGGSASLAMIIQDKTTFNLAKEHDIGGRKVGLFPTQVMNNGVFPMSQYFVQNIEVKLVLEYGAYEYGATVIDIGLTGPKGLSVPYIGANVAGFEGMFRMTGTSSKITKRYDGATDRLIVDIEGGLNLDRMFLHIANYDIWLVFSTKTISIDLDSQYFALPINSNMTVNIKSGANVTAQQDLSLLPGAELNIDGTMTMASGKTLYVYDSAEWVGKGFVFVNHDLRVVPYAPTKSFDRATATLNDAKVIVNGTLDASSGYLYTSASGANICSTGNGIVKINTSNKATTTKNEGVQTNTTMSYSQVSMTSAVLQNKSGTQSTSGGGTFNYGHDKWFKGTHTLTTTETQAPTGAVPGVATITCACGNYTATEPIATIAHKDDNDGDHLCDFGCGTTVTTCADAGKDHICDSDSECTVYNSGSNAHVSDTANNTHNCVYCGKAASECADDENDGDHKCDVCGEKASTCGDEDKDHQCDTDSACTAYSRDTHHFDRNHDHVCDNGCTESIGECTDSATDKDHVCDYGCGLVLEDCSDVTGDGNHSCDICSAADITDHDWVDATCEDPLTCSECGATEGTAPGHAWDDATCTAPKTCSECSATEGTALGHDWDNDCDTDCNRNCGATRVITHNWDGGEVTTDPTCTSLGEKTYTCGVCGEKEYVNVEMAEHEWVDATCAEPKHCENCPATEGETLPHTQWDGGEVTTDPTCTTLGEKTYTCVCGETKTEEVAMIAHEYDDATCTDPETCYCGATTGDPLGHSFTNYVSNNDATCVDNGTETAYCEHNCGTTDTRAAAEGAQGHDWTEATCSAPKTCGVCGETEGEALAHTAGTAVKENKKIQQTTTGTTGSCDSVVYCTACGEEMSRTTQQSLKLTETPFLGMSMSLKDSLALCVAVNVKNMNANYTATITRDYIDENGDPASDTYTVTADDWQWVDQSKGQAMIVYRGMAAKEMCDDITISIYDDNGKLVAAYSDSGRNYGMRMVNKYAKSGTAYPEEAAMFVDMLNYGAAAQQQFHYRENELANALVSPEQQAFATDDIASKDVVNAQSKGVGYSGSSLELENYIGLKFAIQKSKVSTVASAEISYISHNGRAYSKIISVVDFESDKSGKYYVFTAPGLAIADGQTVVTLVLKDGAGNVISTSTDSMESYAGRMKPTGNEWDIYQMILKFSRSAYAYFH